MMRGTKIINREINIIANEHFKKQGSSHELHQFASLFNSNYLSNLADIFLKIDKKKTDGLHSLYYGIELGWIDKKPLVEYSQASSLKQVEVGDALVVYNNYLLDNTGSYINTIDERAVIIQAKVTKNKKKLPSVTVTHDNSSRKEYALYSNWPSFRLKKKNGFTPHFNLPHPLVKNSPSPYAFYLAARKSYSNDRKWQSHWMGAPSQRYNTCNITVGEILLALKTGRPVGHYHVGADFKSNPQWEKLVRTILIQVSMNHTNKGWCGVIMPTRIKGKNILNVKSRSLSLASFMKYTLHKTFHLQEILSLHQQVQANISIDWSGAIHAHNERPERNIFGKFPILIVSRFSSEFLTSSDNKLG
jgi:hypothetical protein